MTPFQGGHVILDEYVRFRHIGTGKFLATATDGQGLKLETSSNHLECLFILRSSMGNRKNMKTTLQNECEESSKKQIISGQQIIVQSFLQENYLQLYDDDAESACTHDDDSPNHFQIINHTFQKKMKNKMMFVIDKVEFEDSIYSYQSSDIFDELVELYCFLNVWAVALVNQEEKVEQYYIKHDRAIELIPVMQKKVSKVMFILQNLEDRINEVQYDNERLHKCKTQIAEQGIIDIFCRCIEIMYYKMTPPPLFRKPFQTVKEIYAMQKTKIENSDLQGKLNLKKFRIDEYIAQDIAREHLNPVLLKMLQILLSMVRGHQENSERTIRYFGILYQQYVINETYFSLQKENPFFKSITCPKREYIELISAIFQRCQKNSCLLQDESVNNQEKKGSHIPFEHVTKSIEYNTINKWLNLLEPVRYIDKQNQNIDKQIMIMNVISMFCRDKNR